MEPPPIENILKIHKMIELWNAAPDIANQLFRKENTISEINDKTKFILNSEKNPPFVKELTKYAYYYHYAKRLFSYDTNKARTNITISVHTNEALILFNDYLNEMGISLVKESIKKKKLLTPNTIDDLLFKRFAPESTDKTKSYLEKNGLFIVRKTNSVGTYSSINDHMIITKPAGVGYHCHGLIIKPPMFVQKKNLIQILDETLSRQVYFIQSEKSKIKEILNNALEEEGYYDDFSIINANNHKMENYLLDRYKINYEGISLNPLDFVNIRVK